MDIVGRHKRLEDLAAFHGAAKIVVNLGRADVVFRSHTDAVEFAAAARNNSYKVAAGPALTIVEGEAVYVTTVYL